MKREDAPENPQVPWTPDPWAIVYYDAGDKPEWAMPTPMIVGSEEADRAVVHWAGFRQMYWQSANGDQSEIIANAHLIARAPDLFWTVSVLAHTLDFVINHTSMSEDLFKEAKDEVEAAMQMLEGVWNSAKGSI